jgi:hypothetical protein
MKKLFTSIALFAGLSISAFAQNCYTGPNTTITPGTGTVAGLHPNSDSLPAAVVGAQISDTIYFTNFTSFSGFTVSSLTIDSIGNLPAGTCWVSNKANNTFAGGENGIIYVSGHNTALPGQYKLGIYIHATAGAITLPPYTNAETIANLRYYVRVICPGASTPDIDTVNGKTHAFIAYSPATCSGHGVGINEVNNDLSNVSVVPNPFTTSATVSFNSDVEGTFTVKMVSLLGATVSSKEVNVARGKNEVSIERNNLSTGIYIMSISNGASSITKKVIID